MDWTIQETWAAATDVVAMAYGVPASAVAAPSRGRGPKPPEQIRAPRKLAVYLTARVCGDNYAAIGRVIGLHKDTVSSHCAEGRDGGMTDGAEVAYEAMEQMVRAKLLLADARRLRAAPNQRELLAAELQGLAHQLCSFAEALSDEADTSCLRHPTVEKIVVDRMTQERAA